MLQKNKNPFECHCYQIYVLHANFPKCNGEHCSKYAHCNGFMSSPTEFSHEVEKSLFLCTFQVKNDFAACSGIWGDWVWAVMWISSFLTYWWVPCQFMYAANQPMYSTGQIIICNLIYPKQTLFDEWCTFFVHNFCECFTHEGPEMPVQVPGSIAFSSTESLADGWDACNVKHAGSKIRPNYNLFCEYSLYFCLLGNSVSWENPVRM